MIATSFLLALSRVKYPCDVQPSSTAARLDVFDRSFSRRVVLRSLHTPGKPNHCRAAPAHSGSMAPSSRRTRDRSVGPRRPRLEYGDAQSTACRVHRERFSLQRPRFDLAHAVRSTHQGADHGNARTRGGRPEQARVTELNDQRAETPDESEVHLVLIPANVGYDSSRPRTASEEPSVVTRRVLEARCRPFGRRPGHLHGTAVRLEPCESGRESSDGGRDGCHDPQNDQ
jgi:hypothetical protein